MPQLEPAIQHTRAVLALTVMQIVVDEFLPDADGRDDAYAKQLRKVDRWLRASTELTKTKALSAGAKHDLDAICDRLVPWLEMNNLEGSDLAERWAALWWVGCSFTTAVRATCHIYGKHQHWLWLDTTAWTFGEMLMKRFPGCDEAGTTIYMEVSP